MPAGLILQLAGTGLAEYKKVNALLNIDFETGRGDWPAGMLSHAAGTDDAGDLVVIEVWESRDAQGRFMQERLGRAMHEGGVNAVPTITWIELVANRTSLGTVPR